MNSDSPGILKALVDKNNFSSSFQIGCLDGFLSRVCPENVSRNPINRYAFWVLHPKHERLNV